VTEQVLSKLASVLSLVLAK